MNEEENNKLQLEVYMPDNLEFKRLDESGLPQLWKLIFIPLKPIFLGDEKSKKLLNIMQCTKLKISIEKMEDK